MWRYHYNLQALYETPTLPGGRPRPHARARRRSPGPIVNADPRRGTHHADRGRSRSSVLTAYGIPTVETRIAARQRRGSGRRQAIGYPVVLKLHSRTITHKTDVGGVQLNLGDEPTRSHARSNRSRNRSRPRRARDTSTA